MYYLIVDVLRCLLATACLDYHLFVVLSTTFLNFFFEKFFSFFQSFLRRLGYHSRLLITCQSLFFIFLHFFEHLLQFTVYSYNLRQSSNRFACCSLKDCPLRSLHDAGLEPALHLCQPNRLKVVRRALFLYIWIAFIPFCPFLSINGQQKRWSVFHV